MTSFLHYITHPPSFSTTEETELAQFLHNILLLGVALAIGFAILSAPFAADPSGPINAAIVSVIFAILFVLLQKKKLRFVSVSIIVTGYASIVISLIINGGIRDEASLVLIALLALISFFFQGRAIVYIGLMTVVIFILLYIAEHQKWILETEHFVPVAVDELLIAIISVGVTTAILRQLIERLISKNSRIQQQATRLREQTSQLTNTLGELQKTQTELIAAKELAETANRAKSDFLSKMSHDLRSPLASIIGFSNNLVQTPALPEKERIEWLGHIQRNGEYLLGLIDNLLDLSRIEAQKLNLFPKPFPLLLCLSDIVTMMEVKTAEKGIQLFTQFDEQLPTIWTADEQRLRQVLINLLENGIKFTSEGSVTLRVSMETAVSATTQLPICFEVIDTGIGIAAADIDHILAPFQQLNEREQREKGFGLGLAICTQLVDMMGGKLMVESQVGIGSRFWFEFR